MSSEDIGAGCIARILVVGLLIAVAWRLDSCDRNDRAQAAKTCAPLVAAQVRNLATDESSLGCVQADGRTVVLRAEEGR